MFVEHDAFKAHPVRRATKHERKDNEGLMIMQPVKRNERLAIKIYLWHPLSALIHEDPQNTHVRDQRS